MANRKKEPGLVQSFLFTLVLLLLIPLPFALYLGGTEWIISGPAAVPKEFIASYVIGAVVLVGGLIINQYKNRASI